MPLKSRYELSSFLLICSLFFSINLNAQGVKGLYVNDFKNIIGDPIQEDALLEFAKQEGFNYLLLYNLYFIHRLNFELTNVASAAPLAAFIRKAKTQYGIEEVGGVGETFKSFDVIGQYNKQHQDPLERFDIYNLEFEFWNAKLVDNYYCSAYLEKNDLACDTDGAFEFYLEQLQKIQNLAHSQGIKSETYIGYPKKAQSKLIGQNCDRVLVHFYRKSDVYKNGNSIYNFKNDRLRHLAPANGVLSVMPIFSSRANHMGPWARGTSNGSSIRNIYDWSKRLMKLQMAIGKTFENRRIAMVSIYRFGFIILVITPCRNHQVLPHLIYKI